MTLVGLGLCCWCGLLWGLLPWDSWLALGGMLALAIPFARGGRGAIFAAGGILFLGGTLLAAQPKEASLAQGLARITVDIARTSCGIDRCTSDAHLRKCFDIETGACAGAGSDRL